MNTCKTCKNKDNSGYCHNDKLRKNHVRADSNIDDIPIYDYSGGGGFVVGDNFGCVHHTDGQNGEKMDIKLIQQKRDELERKILDFVSAELSEFVTDTGLPPSAIYVNMVEIQTMGSEEKSYIIGSVDVRIEL